MILRAAVEADSEALAGLINHWVTERAICPPSTLCRIFG